MGYKLKRILIYPDGVTEKQVRPALIPITTAGIYHNATLGLISLSSDGSNWITIADKNLGATTVYNSGDTLTNDNCGNVFQRGNNYAFPGTKSSTSISKSSTKVDTTGYGPGNYYSSSTWITATPRQNSTNDGKNLRGGVTGTNEAMQGPCANGFHVPLNTEWQAVKTIWTSLGGGGSDGNNFKATLKIPYTGYRYHGNAQTQTGSWVYYWSSSSSGTDYASCLFVYSSSISVQGSDRSDGFFIRPFKNEPRPPYEGESGWTKLY